MTRPPADWYPDPGDPSRFRYWDGAAWTEHRAPRVGERLDGLPARPRGHSRLVSFRIGLSLVGVGLVGGILAALLLVSALSSPFKAVFLSDPCSTPCSEVLRLDQGNYVVFEQIGTSNRYGPATSSTQVPATITSEDVSVTSSAGQELKIAELASTQTIDRNGTIYGGVASFHVPAEGRYRVDVDASAPTRIVVAPGLIQSFARALPGLGVAILSALVGCLGLLVILLAWLRRSSAATSN
jgi:hypothetical protein